MRFLHTMIRVTNLDASIKFYQDVLGMKLLSQKDYPDGKFSLSFLGYGDSKYEPCIELTYNYGTTNYDLGNGFGHIAFGVPDIYKTCEEITRKGGKITRPPGPMKNSDTVLAFVEDPDGYKIELIEIKS